MQRWPAYLAALPASLLRLIAAANRVSLPRRSAPHQRLARVRRALAAKLAAHGHVVRGDTPPEAATRPPAELTRAEVAALLVASAHYRAAAPPAAPPGPSDTLANRLRACLPPALAAATDEAIHTLLAPPASPDAGGAPLVPAPLPEARPGSRSCSGGCARRSAGARR